MTVPGFKTLARHVGTLAVLPDQRRVPCLFDLKTKAESITGYESQQLAGTPSVVLEEKLVLGDYLLIKGTIYKIRDIDSDPDGALARYFLTEVDK